jgi:regulatory protein
LILLVRGEAEMTEITAIKADPRHPSRVQVFLGGRLWRAVPIAAADGLTVGMTLDPTAQQEIEERSTEAAALERVGRLLAVRPRSEVEIRQRLGRAGVPPATIERVVGRLRRSGDIDDGAFARTWVENRMAFRPRGGAMLRSELQRKGISPTTIHAALAGVDEVEAAWSAAGRASRRWSGLDDGARRHKLYAFLRRRGFEHETIHLVLRRIEADEGESEETA